MFGGFVVEPNSIRGENKKAFHFWPFKNDCAFSVSFCTFLLLSDLLPIPSNSNFFEIEMDGITERVRNIPINRQNIKNCSGKERKQQTGCLFLGGKNCSFNKRQTEDAVEDTD